MNPQPKEYAVEVAWGKNVMTAGGSSTFWQDFDSYKVIIVDTLGRQVGEPQHGHTVPIKANTGHNKDCCLESEYTTTVSGDEWPAMGAMLMIVPYQQRLVGNVTKAFTMPIGSMTTVFVDRDEGFATKVTLAPIFTMPEDAAKEFFASAQKYEIARETIHAGVKAKGVLLKNIIVLSVELWQKSSTRRLGDARRLSDFGIKITSEIFLDEEYTGDPLKTESVDQEAMTTALVTTAADAGLTKVTAESVALKADSVDVQSEDITMATAVTGEARPMGGVIFSTIIALAMALTGHQILA